jgi:hypothetical protein
MAAACAQRRFRARGAYTAMVGLALLIAGVVSTVAFTVIAAVGVVLYGSRRPVASTTGTIGRELSRGSCSIRGDWRTLPARICGPHSFDTTKAQRWLGRTLRLAGPLKHLGTIHAPTVPLEGLPLPSEGP